MPAMLIVIYWWSCLLANCSDVDGVFKTEIFKRWSAQFICYWDVYLSLIHGHFFEVGFNVDCGKCSYFFAKERGEWIFELNCWIIKKLTVIHRKLIYVVFDIVYVDYCWVAARNIHGSHEQVNKWCKSFNILLASEMNFGPYCYYKICYLIFILLKNLLSFLLEDWVVSHNTLSQLNISVSLLVCNFRLLLLFLLSFTVFTIYE